MKKTKRTETTEDVFLKNWQIYACIALAGLLVYAKTLFFAFTYFDDNTLILDNAHFLSQLSSVLAAFKQDAFYISQSSSGFYRPLLTVSFILNAQISGTSPFLYHLTNVLLHLSASCLLYVLLAKLQYKKAPAFLAAMLFAVHPALTQAVAWIPGRNDSLLAVFLFAAFICLLRYRETGAWKHLISHLLAFGAALFTKETAAVLVAVSFVYLVVVEKRKAQQSMDKSLAAGWFVCGCAWFLIRESALASSPRMAFGAMMRSILESLHATVPYLGKILLPFDLSVQPVLQDMSYLYGFISILLLAALVLVSRGKRSAYIYFGLSWFVLFLWPSFVSGDAKVQRSFYEHRLYVPIVGILLVLLECRPVSWMCERRTRMLGVGVPLIVAAALLTFQHSDNFKDRSRFFQSAVRSSPHNPSAHNNMGLTYFYDRQFDRAESELRMALELGPSQAKIHNNLGLIYLNTNRLPQAEAEFQKELAAFPNSDAPAFNLGVLYMQAGRTADAETLWKRTIELNPAHIEARLSLAKIYYSRKDLARAAYCVKALVDRGVTKLPPELLGLLNAK
jgi:protein O-mannosyl-transferase